MAEITKTRNKTKNFFEKIKYVKRLNDCDSISKSLHGSKAKNLSSIINLGFNVPEGYAVNVDQYFLHIKNLNITENLSKTECDLVKKKILDLPIDSKLEIEFIEIFNYFGKNENLPLAIRSSSNVEDLNDLSFAGLYTSYLNIYDLDSFFESIKKCWASYWDYQSYEYRRKNNIDHHVNGMGVIIQTMIAPKYSGVFFTSSPLLNNANKHHLEWVDGLGEKLVDGNVKANRMIFSQRSIDSDLSVSGIEQSYFQSIKKLINSSIILKQQYNQELDIEWAIDDSHNLWFLQVRPITIANLQRGNISKYKENFERYSTFGTELAVKRYNHWVIANSNFYVYSFKRDFKINDGILFFRTEWLEVDNVRMKIWMTIIKFYRLLFHRSIISDYHEYFKDFIISLNEQKSKNNEKLNYNYNINDLKTIINFYNDYQLKSLSIMKIANLQASLFKKTSEFYFGKGLGFKYFSEKMANIKSITSERNEILESIVGEFQLLKKTKINYTSLKELKSDLLNFDENREWIKKFENFFCKYGYIWADRYPRDPLWKVNDKALLNTLFSKKIYKNKHFKDDDIFKETNSSLKRIILKPLLKYLQKNVQNNFGVREDRNHYVYTLVMLLKEYLNILAYNFKSESLIVDNSDIFFLKQKEIEEIHEKKTDKFKAVIEQRKKFFFERENNIISEHNKNIGNIFYGECCVKGIVIGRVIKIKKFGDLHKIKEGDILLCSQIRPSWSYIFPILKGVIIENGSLLSHGATLLRESNTPSIINTGNIYGKIPQYSKVQLNCENGEIIIL